MPPTRGGGSYRHRTFREQYSWTERLDRIPNNFLIWGILGLNGFVFFMWQIAMTNAVSSCLYCYSWTVAEWNITSVWETHRCMFTCRKTFFSTGGTSLKAECTYPHKKNLMRQLNIHSPLSTDGHSSLQRSHIWTCHTLSSTQ